MTYLGCYGIGLGRLMAAVVEASHDDQGIIWPSSIAPFQAHLILLDKKPEVQQMADKIYQACQQENLEVLYDDRDKSAGAKFADADLIGLPWRVVVSAKTQLKGQLEIKQRNQGKIDLIKPNQLIARIKKN